MPYVISWSLYNFQKQKVVVYEWFIEMARKESDFICNVYKQQYSNNEYVYNT